jgi:hypothetical protein
MEDILHIIRIALQGLNIERQTQSELLDLIVQRVAASSSVPTFGNALLTVNNIQRYCEKFQRKNQYERKVVLCQSVIRGWLTRKRNLMKKSL